MTGKSGKLLIVIAFGLLGTIIPLSFPASDPLWLLGGAVGGSLLGLLAVPHLFDLGRLMLAVGRSGATGSWTIGLGVLSGLTVSLLGLALIHQITRRGFAAWEPICVLLVVLGLIRLILAKREGITTFLQPAAARHEQSKTGLPSAGVSPKVLDTSAIIDGRIADICRTGFLEGTLLAPGFVLAELQKIADSSDTLKRNRGRRGLDILNRIQKEGSVAVKIYDKDFEDLTEVDTKIVRLARLLGAKVITNDFNLNKVAELYGVPVLNINELSNAIKPVVLPGEEMYVHVIKDGKEFGQGIAYLEDGTMVVVDGGRQHIGEDLEVLVTSVLQTAAGRMIFGKPKELTRQQALVQSH